MFLVPATVPVTLKAVLSPDGDFRVHASTCSALANRSLSQHAEPIPIAGCTREAIAAELHADLIDEGSMTAGEAIDYVTFLPCSGLGLS